MTLPRAYEDQLVERAKVDADAFGELYGHYFGQIYRFVYSRLRDQDAAEDVTSEVFFKALRAIGRDKPSGHPFSAWLYQISVNAIADHYRARRPVSSLDDAIGVADPQQPVADRVAQKAEAARVWAAIDSLPCQTISRFQCCKSFEYPTSRFDTAARARMKTPAAVTVLRSDQQRRAKIFRTRFIRPVFHRNRNH